MNNILFGAIGVCMLAIIGLGVADVKYQAHSADFVKAAPQSNVMGATEVSLDASDTSGSDITQVPVRGDTAASGISRAAAKVEAAYTGNWKVDSDDGDDEDNEEDDDGHVNTGTRTVPAQTTVVAPTPVSKPGPTQPAPVNQAPTSGTYTMAQVAAHASAASCYSAINGNVYDLTSFISQHPGGSAAIKSLCGVDGSAAYNNQHGGSTRPANELSSLRIGVLAQ